MTRPPYFTRRSGSRLSPWGRRWPCSVRTVVGGVVELRELAAFVAVVEEGGLRRRPPLPGAGQLMASNRVPRASPERREGPENCAPCRERGQPTVRDPRRAAARAAGPRRRGLPARVTLICPGHVRNSPEAGMTNVQQDGRGALVTGPSRGIGAAVARVLAARGMRVVVHYPSIRDHADEVARSIRPAGGQPTAAQADVRD